MNKITIIVMLILVSVTITIALNGGLFEYARKASVDTNTSIEEEQKYAEIEEGLGYEGLIRKYAKSLTGTTWKFKDTIDIESFPGVKSITFKAYNNEKETKANNTDVVKDNIYGYDIIRFNGYDNDFAYLPSNTLDYPTGWVWGNLEVLEAVATTTPTIEITGGEDVANPELISWLKDNAIKQ